MRGEISSRKWRAEAEEPFCLTGPLYFEWRIRPAWRKPIGFYRTEF